MSVAALRCCDQLSLDDSNAALARLSAPERARWVVEHLPGPFALTSSFGAQSAVMLHMMTVVRPDIPVVLIDTGYLFPETYAFVDSLTSRLDLNLKVYRPRLSPMWQEARYGKLWEQGIEGIEQYNRMNKVEPLKRALEELRVRTWFSGVRGDQSDVRSRMAFVEFKEDRYRAHPILDWSDRDVYQYLKEYELPYHPLWDEGYISIGDVHTTRSIHEVDSEEQVRFFGLKRECGIHESV